MSKPRRQEVVTSRLGGGDARGGIEEERSGSPGDYSIAPSGPRLSTTMTARDGHRPDGRAGIGQVNRRRAPRRAARSRRPRPRRPLPQDDQGRLRLAPPLERRGRSPVPHRARERRADARNLAAGGFIPILDDIVPAAWVDEWRAALTGLDCRFVALRPRLDVALRRNRERSIWTVDESLLAELHAMLEGPHTDGWLVVDNSEGSPDETATAVAGGLGLITPSR